MADLAVVVDRANEVVVTVLLRGPDPWNDLDARLAFA